MSSAAGNARKRFAQAKAAGSGSREAIIRTHFAAHLLAGRRRSSSSTIRSGEDARLAFLTFQIPLDHLLDYRPEEPILPLETTLILRQKPVEMMESCLT